MWYAAIIESCCHHFQGVIATGTELEMRDLQEQVNAVIADGYHCTIGEVKPFLATDWEVTVEPSPELEYITVNNQPVTEYREFVVGRPVVDEEWEAFLLELGED